MNISTVNDLLSQGENSSVEFKTEEVRAESLAREMVAFSNYLGGIILIGVDDAGKIAGAIKPDMEEWIANVARNNLTPPINPPIQPFYLDNKTIYIVEIPKGQNKPYQTIDGKYWIRVGSTNRIASQSELMRLFQQSGLVHFDISPVERTSFENLDRLRLQNYWNSYYQVNYIDLSEPEQMQLLLNSDILTENGEQLQVSVSGILVFGKEPQRFMPQSSIVFAVFKGSEPDAELLDKKELTGTLPDLIDHAASLIQLFIPKPSTINNLKREETILVPSKVIREALVNCLLCKGLHNTAYVKPCIM